MPDRVHQDHPKTIAALAFDDAFCKRPQLVQLHLFPELVRPACWTAREVR